LNSCRIQSIILTIEQRTDTQVYLHALAIFADIIGLFHNTGIYLFPPTTISLTNFSQRIFIFGAL